MMDQINELIWGKPIDPNNPPPDPVYPENEKMPHEVYNFIVDRCSDACIEQFNNKSLLNSEKECLRACATSFKQNPYVYQTAHQYAGFSEMASGDNMNLPGMGGIKLDEKGKMASGLTKIGGGMI